MSDREHDAPRTQVDLAPLRAALRTLEAPPVDEAALRAQFREAARRMHAAAATSAAAGGWRMHLAAAAVVVLALGAVLAVVLRVEQPAPTPVANALSQPEPVAVSAFQPLLNSPGLSPTSSYSVVRVRIPLAAFALVPGTEDSGSIEADLLVGEDGLARAIRFNADASLASVAKQ
jgi:hypothetical protein